MGSHWGFSFFWKEFLAKHTVDGVVCVFYDHMDQWTCAAGKWTESHSDKP